MSLVVVNAIPPKEEVQMQGINWVKDYYVVKTFKSHMIDNVNRAIDYYHQKYLGFIYLINQSLSTSTKSLHEISGIEEILAKTMEMYNGNVAGAWENIQGQSSTELQKKIEEFNKFTRQLDNYALQHLELSTFLSKLVSDDFKGDLSDIKGTINISNLQNFKGKNLLTNFGGYTGDSNRALGGHRSALFGEIFEQIVESIINSTSEGLLGELQVGIANSILPNNTVAQGKSDIMLFADTKVDGGLVAHKQSFYTDRFGKSPQYHTTKNHNLVLGASEVFDLSYGGLQQALNSYVKRTHEGGMLGISNKAWTGKTGTFGSFSISRKEIENRAKGKPKISEFFSYPEDFHLYTSYVVSKYLINIIGVYNGIISSGSNMVPTYVWLQQLYNQSYTIRHSDNLQNSSVSSSGADWGRKYKVSNRLIIARST